MVGPNSMAVVEAGEVVEAEGAEALQRLAVRPVLVCSLVESQQPSSPARATG